MIARRWLTKTGDFPEEPLDNYLDVGKLFFDSIADLIWNVNVTIGLMLQDSKFGHMSQY